MAFHVRNIATAKAKTAFSRGAAIVTNNKENRVTLYTMKYNAADYNSAKVMSYPANIKFGECIIPSFGVYASRVRILDQTVENNHYGATSIGTRPTFGSNQPNLEVHLFDDKIAFISKGQVS